MSSPQAGPGFDGSKIERELGFEYIYKDNLKASVTDAGQSMIDLGIVYVSSSIFLC